MSASIENLRIWEKAFATDPSYTKQFNRSGGFRGTAINPTYQAQKATEIFGPIGIGWGVEKVDERFAEGAPLYKDGVQIGQEVVHIVYVRLWYLDGGKRGEVYHYGQTTFVGQNKFGLFTDEEAPKKSMTDATTKCLSLLGFAADVYLGLYDDNKYVADLKRQLAEDHKEDPPPDGDRIKQKIRAAGGDTINKADAIIAYVMREHPAAKSWNSKKIENPSMASTFEEWLDKEITNHPGTALLKRAQEWKSGTF